jgi:two-component system response regulator DesR
MSNHSVTCTTGDPDLPRPGSAWRNALDPARPARPAATGADVDTAEEGSTPAGPGRRDSPGLTGPGETRPGETATVRVLVAEGSHLVRGGLIALLSRQRDLEVVAAVDDGDQVAATALELRPDVAIVGADLPGTDGFGVLEALAARLPDCRSLLIAARASNADLRRAAAARVRGFVLTTASPEYLAEAVRSVAAGRKVIDPDLAFAALTSADNPLTPRELDVLRLAAAGAPPADIAGQLCLSVGTVRNYLSRVNTKTGARNRIDAIRIASESGWL